METKKYIYPTFNHVFVVPFEKNPYMQEESEDGFIFNDEYTDNERSGEREKLSYGVVCGEVIAVGPECTNVKEGDHVMYNAQAPVPVPYLRKGIYCLSERYIDVVLTDEERK